MKRYIYTLAIACFAGAAHAQDSYSNYTMTSNADVIGSARYVGMGGAMGALGADISAMSNNPASLGLSSSDRAAGAASTVGASTADTSASTK